MFQLIDKNFNLEFYVRKIEILGKKVLWFFQD